MPSIHWIVAVAAVPLTALAHVLLKRGAGQRRGLRLWLNAMALSGYALMLAVTLMNLYAYKVVPVQANVVLSPLVLFLVTVLSVVALRERLTRTQAVGCALILAGVAIFYL
ncbi:MAG TPA: EamA family transporter [Thermoanaerobaculia bacterium]|nr:EamA family transporter [Thermoanaerobaculia bacterium]